MANPIKLKPNPNTPSIQQVQGNIPSLTAILQTVRQIVQSLTGQSGPTTNRAVTFDDLIALGLVKVSNNLVSVPDDLVVSNGGTIVVSSVGTIVVSGGTLTGTSGTATLTIG